MVDKKDVPEGSGAVGTTMQVITKDYEKRGKKKQLVLDGMSEEDIRSLQRSDPFMYYSIPGVRSSAVLHREIDYSDMDALRVDHRHVRRHSAPAGLGTTVITRRTAISFEAHPDTLLSDLLGDFA